MKASRRYRITVEDESRLRRLASASVGPWALCAIIGVGLILMSLLGGLLVMATPLRTLLPGYLKQGERTATEEGLLRIDSINAVYELNSKYLANIMTVLDTDREPTDSTDTETPHNELPPDSLLPASPREIEYISQIQDREKYNLTILAPLAAEHLQTYPVGPGATLPKQGGSPTKQIVIMPAGSPVCSVADGRVLTVQNPAPEGGCAIVIQHDHGFATRYSHTGTPRVKDGEHVDGGSAIALGARGGSTGPGWVMLEMWHDGTPVEGARYVPW